MVFEKVSFSFVLVMQSLDVDVGVSVGCAALLVMTVIILNDTFAQNVVGMSCRL